MPPGQRGAFRRTIARICYASMPSWIHRNVTSGPFVDVQLDACRHVRAAKRPRHERGAGLSFGGEADDVEIGCSIDQYGDGGHTSVVDGSSPGPSYARELRQLRGHARRDRTQVHMRREVWLLDNARRSGRAW